jgi:hypothetical protein
MQDERIIEESLICVRVPSKQDAKRASARVLD